MSRHGTAHWRGRRSSEAPAASSPSLAAARAAALSRAHPGLACVSLALNGDPRRAQHDGVPAVGLVLDRVVLCEQRGFEEAAWHQQQLEKRQISQPAHAAACQAASSIPPAPPPSTSRCAHPGCAPPRAAQARCRPAGPAAARCTPAARGAEGRGKHSGASGQLHLGVAGVQAGCRLVHAALLGATRGEKASPPQLPLSKGRHVAARRQWGGKEQARGQHHQPRQPGSGASPPR